MKISRVNYSNTNTSNASTYSLNGLSDETTASDSLAQSLLGNNYTKVDLTENAIINIGNDNLGVASSTASTYSTISNSSTIYTFQVDGIGNVTGINDVELTWNGRRLRQSGDGSLIEKLNTIRGRFCVLR